jgi:glutamine synthetase
MEALVAFKSSDLMRTELGDSFHNYFAALKQFEINRFLAAVTDWEHQEYFEMF